MKKSNFKAIRKLIFIFLVLFFSIIFNSIESKAANTGLLGDVGIKISDSDVEAIPVNFRSGNVTFSAVNTNGSVNTTENNKIKSCVNSSGSGTGQYIDLVTSAEYVITGTNNFTLNGNTYSIQLRIKPISIGTEMKFRVENGINGENYRIKVHSKNAKAKITYKITNASGALADIDFCYGFLDPDGADYLFDDIGTADIYYREAAINNDASPSFANGFRIVNNSTTKGIQITSVHNGFDEGLILIDPNNGTSQFEMTWDTTRLGSLGQQDYVVMPYLYEKPNVLNIKINMNGGNLSPIHGSGIGTSGSLVTLNGSTVIHSLKFSESLGSAGLADYNNTEYINIQRMGYSVAASAVYNTKADGTGTSFNQTQGYAATDFGYPNNNTSTETLELFVNWVINSYNISYTMNNGTHGTTHPTSYNVEDDTINISNPTRQGYTFKGWSKKIQNLDWNAGFLNYDTGVIDTNDSYPNSYYSSLVSLKAGTTYTLTGLGSYSTSSIRWRLYSSSGTYLGSRSGTSITPTEDCYIRILLYDNPAASVRSGLVITGTGNEKSAIIPKGSTGNVTLTAEWEPNIVTITINKDGVDWDLDNSMRADLRTGTTSTYSYANATRNGATLTWTGVKAGTYNLYASKNSSATTTLIDTGIDVVVTTGGTAEVNYYTLTIENGSGIESSTGAGIYLTGQQVAISSTASAGNTWSLWTTIQGNSPASATTNSTTVTITETTVLLSNAGLNRAVITIRKDGTNWGNSGINVALKQGTTEKYSYANSGQYGSTVYWTGVTNGTYTIYASKSLSEKTTLVSTGVSITVSGSGVATIDYYTLTLDKSSEIDTVSGAGTYLKNQQAAISCTMNSGYVWSRWETISGNSPASATTNSTTVTLTQKTTLMAVGAGNQSILKINPNGGSATVFDVQGTIITNNSENISSTTSYSGRLNDTLVISEASKAPTSSGTTYTVTFNYNGNGNTNTTAVYSDLQSISYTFTGWSHGTLKGTLQEITTSNGKQYQYTYGSTAGITDTLTAQFTSTGAASLTPVILPTPTWAGHTFLGWYTASTGGTKVGDGGDTYTPTANITLYAHWTTNTVTITIKKDGNNWNNSGRIIELYQGTSKKYSSTAATATTVSFNGVVPGRYDIYASKSNSTTTTADSGVDLVVSTTGGSATIYYYTLTLNKDTGINTVTGAGTHLNGSNVAIAATAMSGYKFVSWTRTSGSSPTSWTSASTSVVVNTTTTLKANSIQDSSNSSAVIVDPNGGSASLMDPTGSVIPDINEQISNPKTYIAGSGLTLSIASTATKSPTTETYTKFVGYEGNGGDVGTLTTANTNSNRTDTTEYEFSNWTKSSPFYGTLSGALGAQYKIYTFGSTYGITDKLTANYVGVITSGTQGAVTLPTATRDGYTLKGWYTAATNGTKLGDPGQTYTPSADVTLYAQWQINSSTLKINPNGGKVNVKSPSSATGTNITTTQSYTQNYNTTLTAAPSKDPLHPVTEFTITYNPNSGTLGTVNAANTTSTRTDTTTYTGTWTQSNPFYGALSGNVYTFPGTSGVTSTITAQYTASTTMGTPTAVTLPTATRAGYTLDGWYTAASGGTKRGNAGATYVPAGSETLYAHWTPNIVTVTIRLNGEAYSDSGINVALYQGNTAKYTYANATKNGEFVSWSAVTAGTYDVRASLNSNALASISDTGIDITVSSTGSATLDYYGLELEAGTGIASVSGTGIYYNGQSASIDATLSTGYTWSKWTKISGNNPASATTKATTVSMTAATNLRADAVINTSKLTVNPSGGSVNVKSPSSGVGVDITTSTTYTQNYNTTLTLGTPTKTKTTSNTNITVSYNGNNGTVATTDANTKSTRTDTTTYAFSSWTKSSTFYGTLSTDNKTYTFPSNNNVTSTITAKYTSSTTNGTPTSVILPNATRTGYTFDGWYTETTGNTKIGDAGDEYTPSANITLAAHWTINKSKLTINPDGGTVNVKSPSTATGTNISTTQTYEQNYNTKLTVGSPTKSNTVVPTPIVVTFNGNGGSNPASLTSTRNDVTTYTFSEWVKNPDPSYGSWSGNTYTYSALNGVTDTITAAYVSETTEGTPTVITLPTSTREGYNLKGWYTAATGGSKVGDAGASYTPYSNIILYAQWEEKTAQLTYNKNGHGTTTPAAVTMKYSTATNAADGLSETGYRFIKWNTKANGSGTSYEAGAQVKAANVEPSDTILYAQWQANTYTIKYVLNSGTHGSSHPTSATYDTVVNISNPTRTGYTFSGWTMTDGNTSTAKYGTTSSAVNNAWSPATTKVTATYFKNLTDTNGGIVTLTANWTANSATVTIKKDNNNWSSSGMNVALYQSNSAKYTYANATKSGATVSWSAVTAGTYDVYASINNGATTTLADTGIDIVVTNTGTATIDYYTLTLNKGVGISAVSGAGIYLKNQPANIDATVSNGYTWQGWSVVSGDIPE